MISALFLVGNLSHLFGPDCKPTLPHQVISSSILLSKVACSFKCWLKSYLYLGKGAWWKELRWQGLRVRDSLTAQWRWVGTGIQIPEHFHVRVCVCVCVCSVIQSCLTLCNPMHCISPVSSVHEIFQAKILEWVAISSSRGSSQPRAWTWVSCVFLIGRQILYPCATWETHLHVRISHYSTLPPHTDKTRDFPSWKTPLL